MTECQNDGENFDLSSSPRVGPPASHCLQATGCTTQEGPFVDCPTLPRGATMQGLPSSKGFQGNSRSSSGVAQRNGGTGHGLQRCVIHSRMQLGILCGAVQELCRCLTSLIESGDLVNLEMLDVARRDPMAPTSKGRAPSLTPSVEPLVSAPHS